MHCKNFYKDKTGNKKKTLTWAYKKSEDDEDVLAI